MKTFQTDFQTFYRNGSFLYDNVFVCDFDVSLAQSRNESQSKLKRLKRFPSSCSWHHVLLLIKTVTQAMLEIPKQSKLLLVSSKKLDTTGCLHFLACLERLIRLNSTQLWKFWNCSQLHDWQKTEQFFFDFSYSVLRAFRVGSVALNPALRDRQDSSQLWVAICSNLKRCI